MTLAGLIAAAQVYGTQAVAWVVANQSWLLPMGSAAVTLLKQLFG
ncbi:hypothetical protein [Tetragenococcus halophilus]|nr:hypothetical protein [Tetragenococcus halophilus]